jgi:hypothetical protein
VKGISGLSATTFNYSEKMMRLDAGYKHGQAPFSILAHTVMARSL